MKARRLIFLLISLIVLITVGGCAENVSQTGFQELKVQLEAANTKISNLQNEVNSLEQKIEQQKTVAELVSAFFSPALSAGTEVVSEDEARLYYAEWQNKLDMLDDPVAKEKFTAAVESDFRTEELRDFLLYLLELLNRD